ncbi:ASCH domain-containing protein, partial [Salmonella enterica]|nr:ASCH domain-containing protein [Salmonella enterica]MDX8934132.1 ASCH domain-containing protein [Salmonella enterica]
MSHTGCRYRNRRRRLTVANLQLAVKGEYFDAMIRGEKTE